MSKFKIITKIIKNDQNIIQIPTYKTWLINVYCTSVYCITNPHVSKTLAETRPNICVNFVFYLSLKNYVSQNDSE